MPGEEALTPDSEHTAVEDEHTRISDKRRFTDQPELEGVPANEGVEGTDLEERLDEDPETAENRRDVPPTPENSYEARTEDE